MIDALAKMGIRPSLELSNGTFYLWASIADLPAPYNVGMTFFEEALKHKVA